jgi:hypothetical protein
VAGAVVKVRAWRGLKELSPRRQQQFFIRRPLSHGQGSLGESLKAIARLQFHNHCGFLLQAVALAALLAVESTSLQMGESPGGLARR